MGELTDSMGKKQKIFLYILLILYILYPIGEIYKVSAPNLDNEESLKKYIEYFSRNISNSSNDEDIKELESLKENFYMLSLVNGWTSIALPFIDFIVIIFYCCGLYNGFVTTLYCCSICLCDCSCILCLIKSALTCPLLLQSLAGIIILITIGLLMIDYHDTKTIVEKLKKRLNIDKIYIDLKSNQTYNALFLAAIIILLILTIVYYCLKKSCCCCCCCSCCDDSSLPNPPKVEIIISQNESKNIKQKQKSSYKEVSIN